VSRPSTGAIALGAGALTVSWLAGSISLAVVGIGLLLAGAWARTWYRRVGQEVTVVWQGPRGRVVEGDGVVLEAVVQRTSHLPVGSARLTHEATALGGVDVPVRNGRARIAFDRLPRGRYSLGASTVVLTDPLGLERVAVSVPTGPAVIVDPRVEHLGALFTDSGARHEGGARALMRRPGGFELHAVRAYQPGEPLRAVHWPSTARRAELMVKELDDVPRDEVVVVLDQAPEGDVGERGSSSFDVAVRAAGSVLRAYAGRGRRVALQLSGGAGSVVRLRSVEREWLAVLDALAAAEADASRRLASVLSDASLPARRAPELVVVTAAPRHGSAMLEERARSGRRTSIVAIDAPTFAGAAPTRADPVLLRLGAAGALVAVVRHGDDLSGALGGTLARTARA
jgi:uncharacterized protein (DUF58 family)